MNTTRTFQESQPSDTQRSWPGEEQLEARIAAGVERFVERLALEWDSPPAEKRVDKERAKNEKSVAKLRRALGVTVGAGLIFSFTGGWFWFVVLVLFGAVPATRAAVNLAGRWAEGMRSTRDRPRMLEATVLRLAAAHAGAVSVVGVAASGGMSLDEAQRTLDSLAARGYATMQISDEGVVLYAFPELAPEA